MANIYKEPVEITSRGRKVQSFNFWIGLSTAFKNELWLYVRDGVVPTTFTQLENLSDDTKEFFRAIYDENALDRLFLKWTSPQAKEFNMLSFYANKPENVAQVESDLNAMQSTYSDDFSILGAWRCDDGMQIGGNDTPSFPTPSFAINFMPDVMIDPGDPEADPVVPPTYERPTQLTDVNLLFGQAKRDFVTF